MFIVSYGKVGTNGSVNTKEFPSEEHCYKEANKLIQSKFNKGYREAGEEDIVNGSGMTETEFWKLIAMAHRKGDDLEEQLEWLIGQLSKKSVDDIIRFDVLFNRNYTKSYTSDLWAAAYIIMSGCSDDSFDYFRAWLLFLGKAPYEEAIRNPESMIPYLSKLHEEVPEFEEFLSCACLAFEEKTGQDQEQYMELYWKLTGQPNEILEMEFDWEEEDEEGLSKKFPRLWGIYGANPFG